ncbi:DUF4293 domain-containing protein [Capnocytophaga felis]|uniref:Transcription termination factor Rho n=1 Tax=Capnocytophaga felis TaxID=2267611 RepID=A0A5M4B8A6_9FLAO|nr:DUF4293 domain-containing protein [Capnocytophaga felis]GET45819.1 hypothetical protein RCZ01_11210 [Capnocytophaga felis]GET48088.1 hypothetical protein RCZ02_09190 [Capnocytophaga felis]
MIQRIQSVYMLIVAVVSGVFPLIFSLYTQAGTVVFAYRNDIASGILFAISAVLAIYGIFKFKTRQTQFVLNRLNILINLTLLGIFVYRVLTSSGESLISEKGVGIFLPVLSIVFLFLANQAIRRDENLVKSADRLR